MLLSASESQPTQGAILLEVTGLSIRAGSAGELYPQVELPMIIGTTQNTLAGLEQKKLFRFPLNPLDLIQDTHVTVPFEYDDIKNCYEIKDNEGFEAALEFVLGSTGGQYFSNETPIELPILILEPSTTDSVFRESLIHTIFETMRGRAIAFYKQPALAAFGCGRVSALVWDSGYDRTTSCVVTEGYTLPQSVVQHSYGGKCISKELKSWLTPLIKNHKIEPAFVYTDNKNSDHLNRRPFIEDSYWSWGVQAVIEDLKCQRCYFDTKTQTESNPQQSQAYQLPDQTIINLQSMANKVLEPLIKEIKYELSDGVTTSTTQDILTMLNKSLVLSNLRSKSKEIVDAVLFIGGNSCFPGLVNRYYYEVQHQKNKTVLNDLKLIEFSDVLTRRHAAFIGASIFASLGVFETYVVTKQEFDEIGLSVFSKRCP